jgi:hypothetical protein
MRERENLNQENGRRRRRAREGEIFKKKLEEGEEQWERGRGRVIERENMKTQNKKKVDEGKG